MLANAIWLRASGHPSPPPDGDSIGDVRSDGIPVRADFARIEPTAALPILARVEEPEHRRRLAWSTAIFATATALSRVLGLLRESVASYYFGVRGPINAFQIAFLIPNTIRALVADAALSSAFVPIFSELLAKDHRARAWRVASSVLWLFLLGLVALTALYVLLAPVLMRAFPYDQDLLVGLSRLLFPVVTMLGVFGIVVGILNSYDEFTIPALTPVAWNLVIILGLVLGVPRADTIDAQLYVYAGSILVATLVQLLLPLPWLRGRDDRLHVAIDWRDPAVRRVFVLMLPVALGLGLINLNALIDGIVAAKLIDPDIAPRAIDSAFRIYMLPQGIFSVAVATVLFPTLSRLAARGDREGFRETVNMGLRQIAFLLVPGSVLAAVLAEPIVRIVYQRGEFEPDQTPVVAAALAAFALGLAFNGFMLMLNRAFFSLQRPWLPTAVALGNLALNLALDLVFYPLGVWGIPLATSLVNVAGTLALLFLLRRDFGRFDVRETAATLLRVAAAGAVLAAVAFGLWWLLDDALGRSFGAQVISLGTALLVGSFAYLAACRAFRVRELEALRSLRRRSRRA
jgi:putative peptidoglycan lipid II flippase